MSWYRTHIVLQRLTHLSACACLVLVAFAAAGGGPYRIADFEPGDLGLTDRNLLDRHRPNQARLSLSAA